MSSSSTPAAPVPRICMLLESYYPVMGGMETQAINMTRCFTRGKMPSLVITRRTSRDLAPFEIVEGIPVHRIAPSMRSSRARWLMVFTALPALVRQRHHYDIILVPGFRALGITAVIIGKLLKKTVILKAESCGEMSGAFFVGGLQKLRLGISSWPVRMLMKLRNKLLSHADAFISLSTEMTEEYLQSGVPRERLSVIAQSVDVDRFQPISAEEKIALRRKLNLPETQLLVMFSGRLVSYKGLPNLLGVWEKICRTTTGTTLIIAGTGGVDIYNCEESIKRFVQEHGLSDRVIFTGGIKNVDEYLKSVDIYAFPTENEAFPLALLEALACALPAVTTTVGGIPDVITNEQNGLLIPPGNSDMLLLALQRLLNEPSLRASLGQAALATVTQRYTREIITQQYATLFNQCRRDT